MKEVVLAPIKETPEYYEQIEAEIMKVFRREIYLPLVEELEVRASNVFKNSLSDIVDAINENKIFFDNGRFTGKLSSNLTRELKKMGATWERKTQSFHIPYSRLPIEIRAAIGASETRFEAAAARITKKLQQIVPADIAEQVKLTKLFDRVVYKVNEKVEKSVRGITVMPELTAPERLRISEEYARNLELYITEFTQKETNELRDKISQRVAKGERYESVIKEIQQSYGVSHRKAKFLARQETSLLMAKFKQVRYESAGVNEYIWGCVAMPHQGKGQEYKPGDVRYYHGILEGKKFTWANPPVVNAKGEKKNPGQDYGCRCFPRPVVRF